MGNGRHVLEAVGVVTSNSMASSSEIRSGETSIALITASMLASRSLSWAYPSKTCNRHGHVTERHVLYQAGGMRERSGVRVV